MKNSKTKLAFLVLLFLPVFSFGQLSIKIDQDTVVLCAGSEAYLLATVTNGAGAQVSWISNSTDLELSHTSGTKTTTSLNVDHKGIDTIILVAEATWNQESVRDSAVLILSEIPDFEIDHKHFQYYTLSEPYLFCENQANQFYGPSTVPIGGVWSAEGVLIPNEIDNFKSLPKERPFYAKYTYSNSVGCKAEDSVQLEIELLPRVEFVTPDTLIKTLEKKHHQHTIPVTYRYGNTSGLTFIALSHGFSFEKTGDTTVDLKIDLEDTASRWTFLLYVQTEPGNACPFVDDVFTAIIQYDSTLLSLESRNAVSRMHLHPNPVRANSTISFPFQKNGAYEVHAFTSTGKEVPIKSYSNGEIQISDAGIYTIVLKDLDSGEWFWERIVVTP